MSKGILVLGAGGHATVCIDVLKDSGKEVAFCLETADSPLIGKDINGVEIISEMNLQGLFDSGHDSIVIAIGDNAIRGIQHARLAKIGFQIQGVRSASAVISSSAEIGVGVAIMPNAVINAGARIGNDCIINSGAVVEHDCQILEGVHVAPNSTLTGEVKVGARTLIGAGSVVIPRVTIGSDVVVGAGSVVINDIASNTTVYGNPARST